MQTAEYVHTVAKTKLIAHLKGLPSLLADLDVTLTMQAKTGGSGGGGVSPKERNAFHLGASEVMGRYHSLLSTLCNVIDRDLGRFEYVTDPVRMARKVVAHTDWLAGELKVEEWVEEFDAQAREYRQAVDRPAEGRVFAGRCPLDVEGTECGASVFTAKGNPNAVCRKCGGTWDASEWRGRALAEAEMCEGTAAQVSRMLSDPVTGEALPQGTIRQWVHRGKLAPIGTDEAERPVYQLRKVRNLWARMKASSYNRAKAA